MYQMKKWRMKVMLNEAQLGEVWVLFADYIDKKQIDLVAERYIELLADFGISDQSLQTLNGTDQHLDQAISYYLEDDDDVDDDVSELDF